MADEKETKTGDQKIEETATEPAKETKKEINKYENIKPGMTVRVYQKIKELDAKGGEKERIQYFEGIIIARKHGKEVGSTITVRKVSDGIGVEKIFPLQSPTITKIDILKQVKTRRSKLYFLRDYKKKIKEKKISK